MDGCLFILLVSSTLEWNELRAPLGVPGRGSYSMVAWRRFLERIAEERTFQSAIGPIL